MRHVIALYDAPVPAATAVRGLADAGFAPDDVAIAAESSVPTVERWSSRLLPHEMESLEGTLHRWGMNATEAAICAEGVMQRGAILVAVRCPTASAGVAARVLEAAVPPDPAEHRARWRAQPSARYMWSHVDPPATA